MTPAQVIKYFDGSVSLAAHSLDCVDETIRTWIRSGKVPRKAQQLIELKTGGKLKWDKKR